MYSHYLMSFVLWISIRSPPLLSQSSALFHDQCCPVWSMKKEEEPRGTLGGGVYCIAALCYAVQSPGHLQTIQASIFLLYLFLLFPHWAGTDYLHEHIKIDFFRQNQRFLFLTIFRENVYTEFLRNFCNFFFLPHHPFFNQRVICTRKLYK